MSFSSGTHSNVRTRTENHLNAGEYRIHLNFLPVKEPLPKFAVYRKLHSPQESRPQPGIMAYRLPPTEDVEDNWPSYWISPHDVDEFERFEVKMQTNPYLTCYILHYALADAARKLLQHDKFYIPDNPFIREISFIQRIHTEGNEQLVVQPYYLRAVRQFGYLVDFHFRLNPGVPFSRKIQQLSLSLDSSFKRNLDYYADRYSKLITFRSELKDVFSAIRMPGTGEFVQLASEFTSLPADRLKTKTYVFSRNKEARSQFMGLREFGPLRPLDNPPHLLFIFREQDRQAARLLARGLRGIGQQGRYAFPGFEALFKCNIEIDSNPIILPDLEQPAMVDTLERVKKIREEHPSTIPVLVLPADDKAYLIHKALFSRAEIPTQVCTLRVLQNEGALKWAIANLALQIFCKAGGYPWKVQSSDAERTLIIGISQSHKLHKDGNETRVERYFAFSVMTDSSGLFQKIQVLGDSDQRTDYLKELKENLHEALSEGASKFSRVVIHTSFKLKHEEIEAIQTTVQDAAGSSHSQFAVIKVNQRSRFFGVNRSVNSLVPFEATRVKLGPGEYLIWFEGIFPDKTTVNKAFPGPTHLKILRIVQEDSVLPEKLLQDLVNLSGANWRGFNAKSAPVSVFYCHLVADFVRHFHERGLPLPAVQDIRPWFL